MTLGNSLRRILLSSLPGYAATSVKIQGVQHEFSTIPGVTEDVTEIVLNVKRMIMTLHCQGPKTVYIDAVGPCEVTAADIKPDADVAGGKTDAEGYKSIFKAMAQEFGFKYVVSTLRESFSASHNGWKAMIYDGAGFYESKRYDIAPIVDRVGGGDSFSGGLIHGLLTKNTKEEALEFAVAASALKHTINGDFKDWNCATMIR